MMYISLSCYSLVKWNFIILHTLGYIRKLVLLTSSQNHDCYVSYDT